MKDLKKLKIAIVHDWLVGGGAERVVQELHRMFPEAPIYTSYCTDEWRKNLDGKVITGWLQHFGKLRKFLPAARMWWFSHLNLSDYDLVISSSGNGEALGVKVPEGTVHVCYCHSPTHFYWRHSEYYYANPGFGFLNPLARLGLKILVSPLRQWDYKAAQRVDHFIANSTHIQEDIKKYYGRDSIVIHPPVDIERFKRKSKSAKRDGYVTVGRQVFYKRMDLIVEACTKLKVPLTVVGRGPAHDSLRQIAGSNVEFVTDASDEDVKNYVASSKAFLFASFEDFGITPVEALAAGTPVIAYRAGGALDYVIENKNGIFFEEQTARSLEDAIRKFEKLKLKDTEVSKSAQIFSPDVFDKKILELLNHIFKP